MSYCESFQHQGRSGYSYQPSSDFGSHVYGGKEMDSLRQVVNDPITLYSSSSYEATNAKNPVYIQPHGARQNLRKASGALLPSNPTLGEMLRDPVYMQRGVAPINALDTVTDSDCSAPRPLHMTPYTTPAPLSHLPKNPLVSGMYAGSSVTGPVNDGASMPVHGGGCGTTSLALGMGPPPVTVVQTDGNPFPCKPRNVVAYRSPYSRDMAMGFFPEATASRQVISIPRQPTVTSPQGYPIKLSDAMDCSVGMY